ncbi:patatin-like phospholipase family protein [Draconibacterium sp. IB214405]|uniref:patatin-like phospholipase family protein n=1 Tax=Draconibacterium sp. IB214405 TaxID=3097352 RepID=UPI002A146B11|nr:patatin-like phospholipase family protein [Draconibacterium sp. IB214405]MDX8339840.1 patatin-like phospholipase family protein [Draconibacterium sp. IB214405]
MNKPLLISLLFTFAILQCNAQSVGLVLSGGGAKGMAHIGVIRVLEENNIPIDYISGTSIGAIVGGLYAAGYTTDEMEELFKSDDFYFWSTGKIQREYRYYFKRQEDDPTWVQLRVAKKDEKVKILPPTNIIPAEQMDFAFMELTAATSAACNYDFNQLMVPYFCIAADVNNSKPLVLSNGDLGNAMRASMTVPLYFKPIEIDGKLLFDGGLLNNFPTDYMKEIFNPDIIIGHKVADDVKAADADDVMQQISNMVMRPTNFEIKPSDGILLETKFDNVGLLDFNKIDTVLARGERTTLASIDSIKQLIKRRVPKETIQAKRESFNSRKPELSFQNIQVEGVTDPMQRQFIIQSIKHKNDIVPLEDLKKEYFKLVADEQLKSIQPITRYNENSGLFDLHLKVEPEKRLDLSIGGNISTKPINQGFAAINFRTYNSRAYSLHSNLYFGRFYSSFKLGGRIDYPTSLPFYLESYLTFNRWDYFSSSTELIFEDVRTPYIIKDETNFRIENGFPLGLHSKLYSGVAYSSASNDFYQTEDTDVENAVNTSKFNAFVSKIGFENNSLNYKQYATEGAHRGIEVNFVRGEEKYQPGTNKSSYATLTADHHYFQVHAHSLRYFPLGNRFVLGTHFETFLSNKDLFHTYRSTKLSAQGFTPSPHSKSLFINEFHANNYLAGGLKAIFALSPDLHLRVEGYGFCPIYEELEQPDLSAVESDNFIDNYYIQGLAALVYQTGIGPVSLSFNYYEKSNTNLYVTLNFGYILFNKRGL